MSPRPGPPRLMWERIVTQIGPPHWRPDQAFALAFPRKPAAARELAIVSWILPQTKATRDDHRRSKDRPSRRWSLARHYGEQVNERLRRRIVEILTSQGLDAVAPVLLPEWDYGRSATAGIASNWSERHAAFAAGLGTFGLSDGLITARGKAVRVGSVLVRADWPATPRPYGDNHRAYCLHFSTGRCDVCARRCPAGAIGPDGHAVVGGQAKAAREFPVVIRERQHRAVAAGTGIAQAGPVRVNRHRLRRRLLCLAHGRRDLPHPEGYPGRRRPHGFFGGGRAHGRTGSYHSQSSVFIRQQADEYLTHGISVHGSPLF